MAEGKVEGEIEGSEGGTPVAADGRIGTVVDKYTIVRMLGKGGMGAVYEAHHARLARRFAIKFLLAEVAANPEVLRRFENEAKAAGGLEHPNIAAVTDFGRASDGSPYLVMEFLEGEDCAKLLRRLGPLPVPRAVNLVVQACRGLAVAHKASIVHRDLKPENLFLTDAGDGSDFVKVLDFGIAKLQQSDASLATGTGATFGTAYYMSPEQARGAGEVDRRADVWSLGVVLYELLSGHKPFVGEQFLNVIYQILSVDPPPLATLRDGLPPKLVAVVERAMAKDADARWPSVVALAEALAPFASKRTSIPPPRPSPGGSPTRPTPETQVGVGVGIGVGVGVGRPPLGAARIAEERAGVQVARTAAAAPRSSVKVMLGVALGVVLIVAAVVAVRMTRRAPAGSATPGSPEIATVPAELAAPPVPARPAVTAPAAAPAPAPMPAPAPPAPAPPKAKTGVRTVFEHSEHDSPKRGARAPANRTPQITPPLVPIPVSTPKLAPPVPSPPPPAPKPAPQPEAPAAGHPAGHPIDIEKDNPYNP